MTENAVIWDFAAGCDRMNGIACPLRNRQEEKKWCRRVILEGATEIPGRSEAILSMKMVIHPQFEATKEHWGTEPAMLTSGVHVFRTLVPNDRWSKIPVRVVNVLSESVELKLGFVVSDPQHSGLSDRQRISCT